MIIGVSRVGEKTYTPREVALLTGYSVATVKRRLKQGIIKGSQIARDGHWRIRHDDLLEFAKRSYTELHFERLERLDNDTDETP